MNATTAEAAAPDAGLPPERLLRMADVRAYTGISAAQVYRLIAAGDFPKPVKLYGKASAWPESEVQAWIAARIKSSRGGC